MRPAVLYIGWTLPHGPDVSRSLSEGGKLTHTLQFTPAGTWKPAIALTSSAVATRREVRKRSATAARVDQRISAAIAANRGRPQESEGSGRFEPGHQGHKDYGLALAWLDRGVGTVVWAMQKHGVQDSTLLAFTSDHGSIDKGTCYSRATLTPLVMQWPGVVQSGVTVESAVSLLDVAATFVHAALDARNHSLFAAPSSAASSSHAAGGVAGAAPLHGISLLPSCSTIAAPSYLRIGTPPPPPPGYVSERKVVCEAGHSRSLVTRSWRYVYSPQQTRGAKSSSTAAQRHPGMLAVEQLYDLSADAHEARELVGALGLTAPAATLAAEQQPASAVQASPGRIAAAGALSTFRAAMQRDLAEVAASCGVMG